MSLLQTTDNNNGKTLDYIMNATEQTRDYREDKENLEGIGNQKIEVLIHQNQDLIVFSGTKNDEDKIGDKNIFTIQEEGSKLTTYNIMGFIGINDTQLMISSRFGSKENDYFLHHMLQRVFGFHLVDFKPSSTPENIYDFLLMYLFPYYLNKAVKKGVYKEYQRREYNNSNPKGAIDVQRHIKYNFPFQGKIAYTAREHVYDNRVTQLIRHTIEHIQSHQATRGILNSDTDTRAAVQTIRNATPSYSKRLRRKVMLENIKKIYHPFYVAYQDLQKLCLQILRHEGLGYGTDNDKVYGILFDGAWLWEEYLHTVLKGTSFVHPENKTGKDAIHLFNENNNHYKRYPDFYSDDQFFVLDAKYKRLDNPGEIDRNDMNQIISYMHVLKSRCGTFIYPCNSVDGKNQIKECDVGKLKGYGGHVKTLGVNIPAGCGYFDDFKKRMAGANGIEESLNNKIKECREEALDIE